MTCADDAELPSSILVGVGIGTYEHLKHLPHAVGDVEELAERFQAAGFAPATIVDQPREAAMHALDTTLPKQRLRGAGTILVLLWAGHAAQNPGTGSLRLFTTTNQADDPDGLAITADAVAEIAARSGASQLLMILDTCYSGNAVVDVAGVVDSVRGKFDDGGHHWVGVLASCQEYERALDGALARKLLDLLDRGPASPALQVRWSSFQAGVRGDDLMDALVKEWEPDRHTPKQLSLGDPQPILRNPRYDQNAPEQVVEHLLWAARGGAQSDAAVPGIWFTGRERPLREIVSWLASREPGLCVLTGTAGCGKSAVAGRIVSLSNHDERAHIAAVQGVPPADLDPGGGSVNAHVQARGLTLERCSELLAQAVGVPGTGQAPNHHDVLAWASRVSVPPVIVIDGLDEAGTEGFRIATDLIAPLAQYTLVLVASREVEIDRGSASTSSLLGSLGTATVQIDLDGDPDATDRDVHDYVVARLNSSLLERSEAMDAERVAREVVRLARSENDASEGPFLLARILTSQLIETPVDTSTEGWQTRLSASVEEAFVRDLASGRPLVRDGKELPYAAKEILSALAYSYGSGFPADDVWPAVASALSSTGTEYGRLDVYWALGEHGRYVTASGLAGQAVYRLHQRLADMLRENNSGERSEQAAGNGVTLVAKPILDLYETFLESEKPANGHPYLWFYAWRHAVDGELPAIDSLKRLSERDRTLRPDVALALNSLGISYSGVGKRAEAVAPTERAVEIYEQLASENPAFLNDLASSLNNLGNRYSEVGKRAEAVAPTERAVEIRERLASENPAFLNDLASSLNSLGIRYGEVGKRAEAVAPTERAVEIRERLASENPAFLNDLARSLNNLGNRYSGVGKRAEAVALTERAVEIRERLASENPAFLNDLARSLGNLGVSYSEVGRRVEAIAPTERAIEIYERLASENPAFLNDLASSLSNLGVSYSGVGKRADAVAPTERAVEIYERLASENPAFLNDLAMSLNNLGIRYSEVGKRVEAIAPTERAVEIYERLASENPAFLNDLAMSLNNLGIRYSEVGKHADAIAPTERAVEIYERLASENPAFLNDLAGSLSNLGASYSDVGRRADAIAPTERAVEIYERLASENPAFLNDLAMSLNNLGVSYSGVDRHADATAPTERAVEIYERLASENPAFLNDLAMSLNNLGASYSEVDRHADATASTERAVEIYERLASENPAFLNDLAMSLNNLGASYSEVGKHADATAPTERAVEIYERLASENPAFLNDLAMSLNNLGASYSGVGKHADATAPTERAVEIYERLASENPAFLNDLAMSLNNLGASYSEVGKRNAGLSRWNAALDRFATDAAASVILRMRRMRSHDEYDESANDLIEAHQLDAGQDTRLTAKLHHICRSVRSRDAPRFDHTWQATTGELPHWLTLDAEILDACGAWLSSPTWAASRDYIASHAEAVLSEAGEIALAEIALAHPNNPVMAQYEKLQRAIRQDGIDSAYSSLLIAEVARTWRTIGDPGESKRFLLEHSDQLFTDDAFATLAQQEDSVGVALLTLIRSDELEQAYLIMEHNDARTSALAKARHDGDPDKLRAVSFLCYAASDSDEQRTTAALHLAIALALSGEIEEAVRVVRELREDEPQLARLLDDVADTITHHPQQSTAITPLLRALSEPDGANA